MKVIDQINGSALFAQSAYSASIATKDNFGRDITATYLTGIDLGDYYKKTETSSKGEISDAIASIPQGDPDVNSFVQNNSGTIIDVDNVVQTNSAQWAENTGDIQVNNYVYNNSGINNEVNNVVTANSGVWNNVTNKLDTTAFTAWSSTIFSGDYELSAGEGISITDDVPNRKTIITNNISAGTNISLVYDQETNKIRIDSEGGTTLTGDAQGAVDKVYVNSGNWISTINNDASALFFAKKVVQGNSVLYGPVISANANAWNDNSNYKFQIRANTLAFGFDDQYSHCSSFYTLTAISSRATSNGGSVFNWDWHLDYRGLGGTFSDNYENVATWSALRNVDIGLTTGGTISSISGHSLDGKTYTGVAPIQVNNTSNEISITGESLSAGPGIDLFESGGYVVISANGGVGAGGTSAYYTTGDTSIFEDTMNINSDGVVTLGSYTPGQLVPTTNLTSDEGKFPMIYCRNGRSYYLLERVRQLPYYNAQTNGVLGMSAGSPAWVPMPNCYCVKLNNVTTSVDLANYTAYDKVTVVHSQEGGNDCHLYWDGKTKVIHSASYCELVKVTDGNNGIKWTFTTSGWTNDNWWDWD